MGNDDIEAVCDDLRMALLDLASNGPNGDDYDRAFEHIRTLTAIANDLNREA